MKDVKAIQAALDSALPASVVGYVSDLEGCCPVLRPVEAAAVQNASAKRRQEFAAGRACARHALTRLAGSAPAIPSRDRAPVWPPHITGSISHADEICIAAVGLREHVLSIGIDVEAFANVAEECWPLICTASELKRLHRLEPGYRQRIVGATFSAKETFFKCQHPLWGRWYDFHDVEVEVVGESRFRLHVPEDADRWPDGAVRFVGRYVLTTMVVFADSNGDPCMSMRRAAQESSGSVASISAPFLGGRSGQNSAESQGDGSSDET